MFGPVVEGSGRGSSQKQLGVHKLSADSHIGRVEPDPPVISHRKLILPYFLRYKDYTPTPNMYIDTY
ncbi:unnamed protein product [Arctogadus glacialis]